MIKARRHSAPRTRQPEPGMLAYNLVVVIAILAGLVAYGSGATLEAGLVRSAVVLLVCTMIGYALNIVFYVTNGHGKNSAPPAKSHSTEVSGNANPRLDLVAGDDDESPASVGS